MPNASHAEAAPDSEPPSAPASVKDVMSSINSTLKSAGAAYASYSCKTVSWDDVSRGTVGGSLSCWGGNITDTRLWAKDGQQLFTVRADNFNEKLGRVSSDELAVIGGNETPGGGVLSPLTLRDFLSKMGKHGAYAGLDADTDLSDAAADQEVSIRFMTTFLPVADESLATLDFAPEMYSYQSRSDSDPANLLLLATTQGIAVQANGSGATKMYHHAVEPSGQICRYWFEAERSDKQVGGAQAETKEEALAAAQRGKATAAVIGTRAMGTRFNVLMTIQVPLKQQPPPPRPKSFGMGGMGFGMGGALLGGMGGMGGMAKCAAFDGDDMDAFSGWGGMPQLEALAAAPPAGLALKSVARSRCAKRGGVLRPAPPNEGKANAARVSRGTMVDRVQSTVKVKKPVRDPAQHVTVTVVIYNTVAGGVPSMADVKAAVDDMEALYAACGWKGKLADDGANFMKSELTVKQLSNISTKLATQPYVPPAGATGLVQGGDVFPVAMDVS